MKPVKTLIFVVLVFMLLAGTMWMTPTDGVKLGDLTFHMPTFQEMLLEEKVEYADVSNILESQFDLDSLVEAETHSTDTINEKVHRASYDLLVQSIHKIEMSDTGKINLARFFAHLEAGKPARIMHYGDSQIEGDRITSYIRNKFQVKFGGTGPGLRPALQPYDYVFSAVQENSGNWNRYPIYGNVDTLVEHNRYGVMGAFSRFAPLVSDSVPFKPTDYYDAEFSISKSNVAYNLTKKYERLRLFYGNAKSKVQLRVFANGNAIYRDSLKANSDYEVLTLNLPDTTDHISLKFACFDSPDIYGVELASKTGVIVDNIALRGSSGTIFTKNDFAHSAKMYNDLNPGFFILQFGGNVMPYIKDQQAIDRYGRWFKSQIKRIQTTCPDAAILVIGPSDMATKVKDKFVTYEYLPAVVDALKEAALTSGCAYWDMYQAMGGHNSMPGWVNAQPELARPDYVHFSPLGAKLIASMFYNALIFEYNQFLEEKK